MNKKGLAGAAIVVVSSFGMANAAEMGAVERADQARDQ